MTKNRENPVSCTDWQTHSYVDGRVAAVQLIALGGFLWLRHDLGGYAKICREEACFPALTPLTGG